ncbi:hypothetical protein BgiBS90_022613 [Biomphalaria glabrata]|nr:hypothetical protein BgiBS90_022613 [Biomphalaria glabrata]
MFTRDTGSCCQTVYKRHQTLCFTVDIPSCIRPYTNAHQTPCFTIDNPPVSDRIQTPIKRPALQSTSPPVSDRIQTPIKRPALQSTSLLYQTVYKRPSNALLHNRQSSCIRPYTNAHQTPCFTIDNPPVSDRIQTPIKRPASQSTILLYQNVYKRPSNALLHNRHPSCTDMFPISQVLHSLLTIV